MFKNQIKIGIMNGRLSKPIDNQIQSFPVNSWKSEFEKAQKCGFDTIEWVFDLHPNPILHDEGIQEIKYLSEKYDIKVNAVCADYFMNRMIFNVSEYDLEQNISMLKQLIQQCSKLGIEILEIPFVDSSSLRSENDKITLIENLKKILDFSHSQNVKITLETDLPPNDFRNLLEKFNDPNIGANYDTGNSAALGYDVKEELQALMPWLTNIHIKDRLYHSDTVPLGTGHTNFDLFFSTLAKINYKGQLIIQGAREDNMFEPEDTCKKYLIFVNNFVSKYSIIDSAN